MLTRIAIVSAPGVDLEKIRSAFRNPMKFTVREFLSMDAVVHGLISFPMEILVMRVPIFADRQVASIMKARRRFDGVSILVIAKEVEPSTRVQAAKIENFKLVQEPHEVTDIAAVAEKLRRGDKSALRLHPRARREDVIQVIDARGVIHQGHFLDFGQMGARVSVPSLKKFEPRESVQLIYGSSSQPSKQHRIEAKIVWSSFGGGFVDQFMGVKQQQAGIRFIAAY